MMLDSNGVVVDNKLYFNTWDLYSKVNDALFLGKNTNILRMNYNLGDGHDLPIRL